MSQINGNKIRDLRRNLGFNSAGAFAKHIGISRSHVYNIENGVDNVSIETLRRVADALNVQLRDIFIDDDADLDTSYYASNNQTFQPKLALMETLSRMVRESRIDTSSYILSNIRSGLMCRMKDKVSAFLEGAEKENGMYLSGLFVTSDKFIVKEIPSEILPEILALLLAYEEDVKNKEPVR